MNDEQRKKDAVASIPEVEFTTVWYVGEGHEGSIFGPHYRFHKEPTVVSEMVIKTPHGELYRWHQEANDLERWEIPMGVYLHTSEENARADLILRLEASVELAKSKLHKVQKEQA